MAHSSVLFKYWHYAFETAIYLINRMPSPVLKGLTSFEKLFNKQPDYFFLRVFDCSCYPLLRAYNARKFNFRTTNYVFLGYSPKHHSYRCLEKDTERIYFARHVKFDETSFPFASSSILGLVPPCHESSFVICLPMPVQACFTMPPDKFPSSMSPNFSPTCSYQLSLPSQSSPLS